MDSPYGQPICVWVAHTSTSSPSTYWQNSCMGWKIYLQSLPQALNNTSFIKVKPLELYLPSPLLLKVAASF